MLCFDSPLEPFESTQISAGGLTTTATTATPCMGANPLLSQAGGYVEDEWALRVAEAKRRSATPKD